MIIIFVKMHTNVVCYHLSVKYEICYVGVHLISGLLYCFMYTKSFFPDWWTFVTLLVTVTHLHSCCWQCSCFAGWWAAEETVRLGISPQQRPGSIGPGRVASPGDNSRQLLSIVPNTLTKLCCWNLIYISALLPPSALYTCSLFSLSEKSCHLSFLLTYLSLSPVFLLSFSPFFPSHLWNVSIICSVGLRWCRHLGYRCYKENNLPTVRAHHHGWNLTYLEKANLT